MTNEKKIGTFSICILKYVKYVSVSSGYVGMKEQEEGKDVEEWLIHTCPQHAAACAGVHRSLSTASTAA